MATLYSNELKAVVIADDFIENPQNVLKENCITVQHFDYQCERQRNAAGDVYGASIPVMVNFTIRLGSMRQAHSFFANLVSGMYYSYSFLFNPTFNQYQRLSSYDDGMVVNGYVVHVKEIFNTDKNQAGEGEQVILEIRVLTRSVTYLGREESNNYKNTFIQ